MTTGPMYVPALASKRFLQYGIPFHQPISLINRCSSCVCVLLPLLICDTI